MKKMKNYASIFIVLIISLSLSACNTMTKADPNLITMYTITEEGTGDRIGTVKVSDTPHGTLFTPDLKNLPPGLHGFHVHEGGECGPGERDGRMVPGHAAGGHYDPEKTGRHEGPYGAGHLGDLPPLHVNENGRASLPVLAPRLKISDLSGRSLMIHGGGDNYSDHPEQDGGGGPRIACGVIPE